MRLLVWHLVLESCPLSQARASAALANTTVSPDTWGTLFKQLQDQLPLSAHLEPRFGPNPEVTVHQALEKAVVIDLGLAFRVVPGGKRGTEKRHVNEYKRRRIPQTEGSDRGRL